MKNRTMLYLLFFQLIALTLLFPYTPKGEQFMQQFFLQGNLREEELIPTPSPTPLEPISPPPTPVPLSLFYTEIGTDLPGYYDLVSIRTENDEFSDGLLSRLQQLGVPMILELKEDGRAVLGIFDQAIALDLDAGRMLIFSEGKAIPFFYLDGQLRIQDGNLNMIFEKRS